MIPTKHSQVVLIEQPPNPNILNLHIRRQLTTSMSETFNIENPQHTPYTLRELLQLQEITELALMRHHIRLRKRPQTTWEPLLPQIQHALHPLFQDPNELLFVSLHERNEMRRSFPPHPNHTKKNTPSTLVFEGFDQAQTHPIAKKLFQFNGLTTIIIDPKHISVKRSPAFDWNELLPQINHALNSQTK